MKRHIAKSLKAGPPCERREPKPKPHRHAFELILMGDHYDYRCKCGEPGKVATVTMTLKPLSRVDANGWKSIDGDSSYSALLAE